MKNIHRLVVLPDYQGLGLGGLLLNKIAELIKSEGNRCNIITSSPPLIYSLKNSPIWACKRIGRTSKQQGLKGDSNKSSASNRLTISFEYNPKTKL